MGQEEKEGFSLYLSICGLQKGPGKFLVRVLEKSWIILSVKEWEPCAVNSQTAGPVC